jgi:hypothetical protein
MLAFNSPLKYHSNTEKEKSSRKKNGAELKKKLSAPVPKNGRIQV